MKELSCSRLVVIVEGVVNMLTEEQQALLRIYADPVLWAKHAIGWEARDYQADILRDSSKRIVLRAGRRAGKTDVMIVKALYHAFLKIGCKDKHRNYRVLVIAPMDEQIMELFGRLRELIRMSEDLQNSVVEDTKKPNLIKFGNNATIRGVTAGTKSGTKAMNVRGKGANLLMYDEMDYLSDDDIANSYAIVQESKDIYVIGASTPSGRRSWFFNWCTKRRLGFNHYHIPSYRNPNWNKRMEEDLRSQYAGVKYLHEVEAEFGESEMGVIPKRFIDAAIMRGEQMGVRYQSPESPFQKRGPRILGVDWDRVGAETHLIGLEFDRESRMFYPFLFHQVPRHKFTFSDGLRDVIEFDGVFDFDHIVVDRGYGEGQIEEMQRYGLLHPETRLNEKIMPVTFGGSVEVHDPLRDKRIKYQLKNFIVWQLAKAFEDNKIALVPKDYKTIRSLEEYTVVSMSTGGKCIFSSDNDHIILTLAMAYYGFVTHYTELIKMKPVTKVYQLKNFLARPLEKEVSRDMTEERKNQQVKSSVSAPMSQALLPIVGGGGSRKSSPTGRGWTSKGPRNLGRFGNGFSRKLEGRR